jgi:hypothetical protein
MRVVDAKSKTDTAGIKAGRKVLAAEIANPSMSVMIIRGDAPQVSTFVDNASLRCDPFPWRQGVWVRKPFIFPTNKLKKWFGGHDSACAVILSLNDEPVEWLVADTEIFDLELAWLRAEGHS